MNIATHSAIAVQHGGIRVGPQEFAGIGAAVSRRQAAGGGFVFVRLEDAFL
jgi:hypothetical protein